MLIYLIGNGGVDSKKVIIHFGIGLIGSAIRDRIIQMYPRDSMVVKSYKFEWSSPESMEGQIEKLFKWLLKVESNLNKVQIIWTSGKVKFTAKEKDCRIELFQFSSILSALRIEIKRYNLGVNFMLFSSAGGLFEGQRRISLRSIPHPIRPYGKLKLEQERLLIRNCDNFESIWILRPSSVYSVKDSGRKGLIQVLLDNGIQNKVTTIYGGQDTLRDYISTESISDFVVLKLFSKNSKSNKVAHLVSTKPSSIYELKNLIEVLLDKKIYIRFSIEKENEQHITFSESSFSPRQLALSTIETSVKQYLIFKM